MLLNHVFDYAIIYYIAIRTSLFEYCLERLRAYSI
jgi:hypothetical protein